MSSGRLASVPYDSKGRTTRRERFLAGMNAVISWVRLLALILPHYAVAGRGRRPLPLETMLRVYFFQQRFDLSYPQAEDMLYDCAGYYAAQDRVPSTRATADVTLAATITDTVTACHGRYGAPRMRLALPAAGHRVGRKRVAPLVRAASLQARRRRRVAATTDSAHSLPPADNVVARQFTVVGPVNTVWVSGTTFIPTGEGWVYLAVVIDLASRFVVGRATSARNDRAGARGPAARDGDPTAWTRRLASCGPR